MRHTLLCPKCSSDEFITNTIAYDVVSFCVDDDKQISTEIIKG